MENHFLIIETKKKYEDRLQRRFHVMDREVLGQVVSYCAILKKRQIYVPYFAIANDKQIAIFRTPENVDKIVDWKAIERRDYGRVLSYDKIAKIREEYLFGHTRIRFTEDFFFWILKTLVEVYKEEHKFEELRQPLRYSVIEDLRGFVEVLSEYILDSIASYDSKGKKLIFKKDEIMKKLKELEEKGYTPTPEQLAREMSYVFMNKIIFYKVLERFYDIEKLEAGYEMGLTSKEKYLNYLYNLFDVVSKKFKSIFKSGIYDLIDFPDDPEVLKLIDWLIDYIEIFRVERLTDIIGYIYQDLIPAEERHILGQFYTPQPIAELITKWCIRSSDDVVMDTGCGSGTFTIEAYKRLVEKKFGRKFRPEKDYIKKEIHENILNQIYSIDIIEFPCHLTSINLAMLNPRVPSENMNIIQADFFFIEPREYNWSEIDPDKSGKIELDKVTTVVGNPPYTRWTEIPALDESKNVKERSTRWFIENKLSDLMQNYELTPVVSRGMEPGIYIYWIMHATSFLRDGGRLGMIISDSWFASRLWYKLW